MPDGDLLSNVIEMSRYVTMVINKGELDDTRILSRKLIEATERSYVDVPWKLIGDGKYGYGLW